MQSCCVMGYRGNILLVVVIIEQIHFFITEISVLQFIHLHFNQSYESILSVSSSNDLR